MPGKILLVGNFLSHTGANRGVCEDLAHQLEKSGWEVIVTSRHRNRVSRLLDMLKTSWVNRHIYQVVYVEVFSGLSFVWAEMIVWVLRVLKKPYVLTLHGGNLPGFAKKWPERAARLLAGAGVVTAPSPFLIEAMKPYRQDLYLLPNPIDLSRYPYRLRDQATPKLMWLRAFHSVYNPPLAPKVIYALRKDYPDSYLTMLGPDKGDGSYEATKKMAQQLGVEDHIQFVGSVPKAAVPEWLDKGDIYINTSNIDNTPVTIMEAMACGLCIVSTDVGGIPYLLEHEHDALLVPPDYPNAMADAIGRILSEPGLSARLSHNARQKADRFDWGKILPQWEKIFSGLINSNLTDSVLNDPLEREK